MPSTLTHLVGQNRYVFASGGEQVGLVDYVMSGDEIHLVHTEINPQLRGRGLGARMVEELLDTLRTETSLRVVPACPFVADWVHRHPDYQELTERGA